MKSKQGFKGIPAASQKAVSVYMAVRAADGKRLTPIQAYREIEESQKARKEEQARKDAAWQSKMGRQTRKWALDSIGPSLNRLCGIAEELRRMEKDETEDSDILYMIRCALEECGRTLEKSLFDLGTFKGSADYETHVTGIFNEVLKHKRP